MIRVTIGGTAWVIPSLDDPPADCANAMLRCYQRGEKPTIEPVDTTSDINGTTAANDLPFPETPPVPEVTTAKPMSTWEHQVTDDAAKIRIEDLHAKLIAGGVKVDASQQLYSTGTRMADIGYDSQHERKAAFDRSRPIADAAHSLVSRITAEKRDDVTMSAGDLARAITVNGKVHVNGKALTEQAIRGLAARLSSPMLGYLLGVRDRMIATTRAAKQAESDEDPSAAAMLHGMSKMDREAIAEVLVRECKRAPDTSLVLRTRNGNVNDVFAIVSPSYVAADAPAVLPRLLDGLPDDAKGEAKYDPTSTAWELRANIWTPTPVDEQAVGEPFSGYASLRGRDNGTGRLGGGGGIELIRCLNASVYMAEASRVQRVHRGKILSDVGIMIEGAKAAIGVLCQAWGKARETVIPQTDAEKAIGDQFMRDLFKDMLKNDRELVGVLPGKTDTHVSGLLAAYHAERREPNLIVKADLGQAWTRYIQGQPGSIRQDAEQAIGRWMVDA